MPGSRAKRVQRSRSRRPRSKRRTAPSGGAADRAWLASHGTTMLGWGNSRIGSRKVRGESGRASVRHTHAHSDPHHHVGMCSAADRRGKESHGHALKRDEKGRWY